MHNSEALDDFSVRRETGLFFSSLAGNFHKWFYDDLDTTNQSLALDEPKLSRLLRLTSYTLSGATGLFILWAAITPVKELARTEGQVLPSGYNQIVQHLEGGLVRSIDVHEGDFVQKDQILARLDGVGTEGDFQQQSALVASLELQKERLKALLDNRAPDFSAIQATQEKTAEQQHMYESTRDAQASERQVLDEQIAQKKSVIARLTKSEGSARTNLASVQEGKTIYDNLLKQGLTSRTAYLKKSQEYNDQLNEVNSLNGQIDEARRELDEFLRRRETLVAQQRDSDYSDLQKIENSLAEAHESMTKLHSRVDRLEIRSPVAGYVKGLRVNTIGSVVPAGETLMEIVPVGEQLIVEARILPQQVGRVAVGQEVQVKVDSYDYVRYGTIPGKLESISAMTFTDEIRRQDYYKGRVLLDHNYAGTVPGAHLIMPGMTVDADIVTGEKTVLGYILKPIQVVMHNAMSEQ